MMASALTVARFFLDNRFPVSQRGKYSPQDIQDLIFIADGYHMAILNQPLVDTKSYAFQNGPVQKTFYRTAKNIYITTEGYESPRFIEEKILSLPIADFEPETEKLLYQINGKISSKDSVALRNLTHLKGSPWERVWNQTPFDCIPDELTRDYYLITQGAPKKARRDLKPIYRNDANEFIG